MTATTANTSSLRTDSSVIDFSNDFSIDLPKVEPLKRKYRSTVTEPSREEYILNHMCRSRAIIFNHEKFEDLGLPDRKGTTYDKNNLKRTLESLHFDVEIKDNLTKNEIMDKLQEESKNDAYHQSAGCIVIVVLTHGQGEDCLHASDTTYTVSELWHKFTAVNCPALAKKPKIFIIQASRYMDSQTVTGGDSCPAEADFLVAYSTSRGQVAYRDIDKGTWFIQELCKELEHNGQKQDFLSLLTNVNRRVAMRKEGSCFNQIPVVHSTLTHKLFFRNYKYNEDISMKFLEESNKKLRSLVHILETMIKQDMEERRPHQKQMATNQWNDSKANIKPPTIFRLADGLQLFFDEVPQPQDIQQDGETLLKLVSDWKNMDQSEQNFLYTKVVNFLVKYAKEWKKFELLEIPQETTSTGL